MPKSLNKINWQAFSSDERNKAIEIVKSIIAQNDGYIIYFKMFSDLALSLTIEIEENRISGLYRDLQGSISITEPEPTDLIDDSTLEWRIFMNISFSKGKGALKVEIPSVPG